VKLFKNGRNQAVRIPREFELSGEDVIMRKEGDRLIIEPTPPKSLLAVLVACRRDNVTADAAGRIGIFPPGSA
jgi:virulence-associated protein VagC